MVGEFGDVHEAFLAGEAFDESAEFLHGADDALVRLVDLDLSREEVDLVDRAGEGLAVGREDCDPTGVVLIDVELATGVFRDALDVLAARTDECADLIGRNLDAVGARGAGLQLGAGGRHGLGHDVQDRVAGDLVLGDGFLGDAHRETVDLEVQLEGGDAFAGAADLEVHVAVVVFGADDVGEHAVLHDLTSGVFSHETAGDTGDRGLDGHAGVEESEGAATDGSHRGGAVGFHDLGDETDGVREVLLGREDGEQRALSEVTVAGFAAGGHAETAGLTHREGREVVVQEERALARAAGDGVDFLGILGGTEGREDETLGFAALEERGTMDARKHVNFTRDSTEIQRLAAVGAFAALDDRIAVNLLLELLEGHLDLAGVEDVAEFSLTGSLGLLDHGLHGVATFLLGSEEDCLLELVAFGGHAFADGEGLRFADNEREDALGLGVHRGELALGGDDRLDGLLGVFEGGDEIGFGQLVSRTFDHHHVALVADVDEIQVGLILLFVGRVDDELAGDATEADTGDRSVPRNVGAKESGGSAVHHEHVGVVDLVS